MQQPAHRGPALLRTVCLLAGPGFVLTFLLLASCDEVERHKALTFFFDGVPPLQTDALETKPSDLKDRKAAAGATTGDWHIHEPLKNCTECHGQQRQASFSRKVQLVAEVPQLCYKCHGGYSALESWVHGPVATGDCLVCHEPHKTKAEFLLRKPVPELCYQCHDLQAVRTTRNHAEESYSHCTDCHDGHASATKSLLRRTFLEKPAGLEYLSEIHRRKYEEALRKAKSDLLQGQDFLAVSGTIIEDIEGGQLWPARAYLEVLLDSRLTTDAERPLLSQVLEQVVALQTSPPAEPSEGPGGRASSGDLKPLATALRAIRDQRSAQARNVAEQYYRSVKQYRAGQLVEARAGFRQVLSAGSLPEPMKETAQTYLDTIEETLTKQQEQAGWHLLK